MYKGVECQDLEEDLPLKMDINYKGDDFDTGMDMFLFVMEYYDLIVRSIEYAEKFLFSYERNPCEFCKFYNIRNCITCVRLGDTYFNFIPIYTPNGEVLDVKI